MNKREFSASLLVWTVLFFSFGQFLFGCAPIMKEAQVQWGNVAKETIKQQGQTDRELLRQQSKCGNDCDDKDEQVEPKETIVSAPMAINIPTKKTIIPEHTVYSVDDGEEITIPERIVEETDHAALAVLAMSETTKILAMALDNSNGNLQIIDNRPPPQQDRRDRIVYPLPPQPETDTISSVTREVGDAVSKQGWIADILQTWFVMDKVAEIAKAPNSVTMDSGNPTTTTMTTTTTMGVE